MSTDIRRDDTGIYTSEGNVAGATAAKMSALREKQKKEYEEKRREIEDNSKRRMRQMDSMFAAQSTHYEDEFKAQTVGLLSAEEFKKAQERLAAKAKEVQARLESATGRSQPIGKDEKKKKKKKRRKQKAAMLSFANEEVLEEVEEAPEAQTEEPSNENGSKRQRVGMNPNVQTDFLPDRERENEEAKLREQLKQEWKEEQERIKKEKLEITYSYWDGSGHRRAITVPKGTTIGKFLEWVREDLVSEFPELKSVSSENLLYVKEDLIIPHTFSFYDLIVTKARGKSGPLFMFDVHDDVRLVADATVEKEESHPGKIVERRWYERNKHIFPASRWEVYDPSVMRGKYTIHGSEVVKK